MVELLLIGLHSVAGQLLKFFELQLIRNSFLWFSGLSGRRCWTFLRRTGIETIVFLSEQNGECVFAKFPV
jgi:hypothetical protein